MQDRAYQTRIPLYEIDMGGGMYHGNYFHIFEQAREHFLESRGFPYSTLVSLQRHLTVAEVTVRYRLPLLYNDAVRVVTTPETLKTRSLVLTQTVYRGETVCTEARFSLVCVDFSGTPQPLPDALREALQPGD